MTFKVPLLDTNNDNIKLLENICGEKNMCHCFEQWRR